jgi:hypothetical protein
MGDTGDVNEARSEPLLELLLVDCLCVSRVEETT